MAERIAAVVATYNRCQWLRGCLSALLKQTRPLDRIIVVDNASTDETPKMLAESYPQVTVLRLNKNAGSSGGVEAGMRAAIEDGCDWVWVMDDDAEPVPDALAELCHYVGTPGLTALACLKVDPQGRPLLEHRGRFVFDQLPRRIIEPVTADVVRAPRPIDIDHCSFVGLLVHAEAARSVGYPDPRLFLQFDDVEYCIRLRRHGKILLVPTSRIIHHEPGGEAIRHRRLLGLPYEQVPASQYWKRYFTYRNFVWLSRKHGTRRAWVHLELIGLYLFLALGVLLFEDRRVRRWRLLTRAFVDGWRSRFDNTTPFNLMSSEPRSQSGGDR